MVVACLGVLFLLLLLLWLLLIPSLLLLLLVVVVVGLLLVLLLLLLVLLLLLLLVVIVMMDLPSPPLYWRYQEGYRVVEVGAGVTWAAQEKQKKPKVGIQEMSEEEKKVWHHLRVVRVAEAQPPLVSLLDHCYQTAAAAVGSGRGVAAGGGIHGVGYTMTCKGIAERTNACTTPAAAAAAEMAATAAAPAPPAAAHLP